MLTRTSSCGEVLESRIKPRQSARANAKARVELQSGTRQQLAHDVLQNPSILPLTSPCPLLFLCISINMAGIRPPLLDAALRSCTRARRAPALRNASFSKQSPAVQRRWIGDMNGRPPVPPGRGAGKNTVVAPRLRLAVGVVFISALIYSMVYDNHSSQFNGKDG